MNVGVSVRDELLDTAVALFQEFGFGAVSLNDIVAKSKISKNMLYKHFGSKEDLILFALNRLDEQSRSFFATAINRAGDSLRSKLMGFFRTLGELFDDPSFSGCLFINATVEYPELSEPVHRMASDHKNFFRKMMYDLAIDYGIVSAKQLSEELMLVFDGVCVTYQRNRDPRAIRSASLVAECILDRHQVR